MRSNSRKRATGPACAGAGTARAGPVARFLLFERNYPDSVAAAVDAVNASLRTADAQPRNSEPILRLSRLSAALEFRRSAEGDADYAARAPPK